MRKGKGDLTIERLENEGWEVDREALASYYVPAGGVSKMKSRNEFEYCRVHHGRKAGVRGMYQITTVMKKMI